MNRENFNIETAQPSEWMSKNALEETKRQFSADDERAEREKRIKELTEEYDAIMQSYIDSQDGGNEELAEELLNKANKVMDRLNAIDPKIKGNLEKSILQKDLESEAKDLTEAEHKKNSIN